MILWIDYETDFKDTLETIQIALKLFKKIENQI